MSDRPFEVSRFPSIGKVGVFKESAATFYDDGSGQTFPVSAWRAKD